MAERYMWTEEETRTFIDLVKDKNITAILDSKQQRNAMIYQELSAELSRRGFGPWTALRNKWKSLKQKYLVEKRTLAKSGSGGKTKFKFYAELDNILGQRPIVTSLSTMINSSSKVTTDDGDQSMTEAGESSEHEESPDGPGSLNSSTNGGESQPEGPSPSRRQRTWSRVSTRPTSRQREMTPFFEALLQQQQEQSDKDQQSISSISAVLGQAVQCFQRCAEAAERQAHAVELMAYSGQQGNNQRTHLFAAHSEQPSCNRSWSTSNSQPTPLYNQHPSTSTTNTQDSSVSFSSFLNL